MHPRGPSHEGHISIHAPRAGCDPVLSRMATAMSYFNPRTPCGVRLDNIVNLLAKAEFQSTHPVRGATLIIKRHKFGQRISIHAPRAGCDSIYLADGVLICTFQSTHPVRGATHPCILVTVTRWISIHAPRAGCDLISGHICHAAFRFQSTHPVRGATPLHNLFHRCFCISIHAPRAGCDLANGHKGTFLAISIHAPRAGCDCHHALWQRVLSCISIHAPRAGCDNPNRCSSS